MNLRKQLSCLIFTLLPILPLFTEGKREGDSRSLYEMAVDQLSSEPVAVTEEKNKKNSPDVDRADEEKITALMLAAKEGNDWAIKKMLESGVDVNARDSEGWTALM
ncbi:MAG: ankyrin repeat domain-containing protein, partial [Treponema sp.]|nr:ankyrin repeat domain-containing protein [Treponema sp.]